MAKRRRQNRRYTILLVPEGTDAPRSVALSGRSIRAILWTAAACATITLLTITGVTVSLALPSARDAFRQNRALGRELGVLRGRLRVLQDTIAAIGQRDEKIRLLAGLPSVDSAVREAGIGGPGGPDVRQDPLYRADPVLGRLAFDTRSDIEGLIRRANILATSFDEVADSLSNDVERLASTPSIMPTAGWLSSQFSRSRFHPILHISRPHEGIDVSAPMGAPVVAPANGTIVTVTHQRGYGLVLEIDHGNDIVTKYAHLSKVQVRVGQRVTRGQTIANVGNSGLSTGPHLHYEIHVNGKVVDPLTYVLPGAIPD